MALPLAPTFLNIVMVFTWLIYGLLAWELGRRTYDSLRIGTGLGLMLHVLVHLNRSSDEKKDISGTK
jgi:hypothetical protein